MSFSLPFTIFYLCKISSKVHDFTYKNERKNLHQSHYHFHSLFEKKKKKLQKIEIQNRPIADLFYKQVPVSFTVFSVFNLSAPK